MGVRARGLGMVTGQLSGYVVIDVDLEGLPLMHELGWKPHVISPSGGAHLYLRWPGWFVQSNASKSKKTLPPGFDVRGDGGYIMFPPSRNRQGFYRRTDQRQRLSIEDVPETITVAGETYPLRQALGLTPPVPQEPRSAERPSFQPSYADDERCPMFLMLDRAADYAADSRNKGAFMLGLWANANDYSVGEAIHAAGEYTDMVQGVKRTPFTLDEAQRAVASAYTYLRKDRWTKREELSHDHS
ncbi:bifunctional DNA primase/polymerase [Deinococcus frigens]